MCENAWGGLTGIRPAKVINGLLDAGLTDEEVFEHMKDKFSVDHAKIALALDVAKAEREIFKATFNKAETGEGNGGEKVSLYVGIPFCPTTCLYCSFTSYPLAQYGHLRDAYVDALIRELRYIGDISRGMAFETVYIGGGTPTSLCAEHLERLLVEVNAICGGVVEFTVECGRPDTITAEKLRVLKAGGVSRISVNPQSMKQETLDLIGRRHTVQDFYNAYECALAAGFEHINIDLILGLPGETPADVENTFVRVAELNPKSVTVHTLAVKRASRLRESWSEYELADTREMEEMLAISASYCGQMGLKPYYLYRLKNTAGGFENAGYCREGCACVYNVQSMAETQTILAAGAGATTKLVSGKTVRRAYNVKSVQDYISRTDEMIERKRRLYHDFYQAEGHA